MGRWRIALWVGLVFVSLTFLYLVRQVLLPFILAFIISVLLDPTIKKLSAKGWKPGLAIGLPFVVFFTIVISIGIVVTPVISTQLSNFTSQIKVLGEQLSEENPNQNFYVRWNPAVQAENTGATNIVDQSLKGIEPVLKQLNLPYTKKDIVEQYIEPQQKQIAKGIEVFFTGLLGAVGRLGSQLFLLIFTPLLVFFMLSDMDRFKRKGMMWIPPSIRAETIDLLQDVGGVFTSYMRGVAISISIYMVMMVIVLSALQVPYSILLGILFGAIYLIPYIGPLISASILILTIGLSGNSSLYGIAFASPWTFALVCLGIYLVFDRGFDTFVYPNLVGKSVGLNPLASMFVTFCGGALFGIIGMLLAFPVAGAVKVILDRIIKVTSSQDHVQLPLVPARHRNS